MTGSRHRILFHDLAGRVGWAFGVAGEEPIYGSHPFAGAGADLGVYLLGYEKFALKQIDDFRPTAFIYEAAFVGEKTSIDTATKLISLTGIASMCAARRGVRLIRKVDNQSVCHFFTGKGRWKNRDEKKAMTIRVCRTIGWSPEDDDAGDGLAGWSFSCHVLHPDLPKRHWIGPLLQTG